MERKEMEQYIDEMYEMHTQLSEIHRESARRLVNLLEDNRSTIEQAEKIKQEIIAAVRDVKAYNNMFILCLTTLLIAVVIAFSWKFSSFSSDLNSKLYITYDTANKAMLAQAEHNKILQEIKGLCGIEDVERVEAAQENEPKPEQN